MRCPRAFTPCVSPAWAEQSPADWWDAVTQGIRALLDGQDAAQETVDQFLQDFREQVLGDCPCAIGTGAPREKDRAAESLVDAMLDLRDGEGAPIDCARHPMMPLRMRLPVPAERLSILRKIKA